MKKRSLIASIAMLLVSAIVLTSSTYAWFATGTTAKVSNIQASIVNNDGTIALAASEAGPYKTALNKADLMTNDYNYFPEKLYPYCMDWYNGIEFWGKIVQDTTAGSSTYGEMIFRELTGQEEDVIRDSGADQYMIYVVYVKASKDCTVEVTPSFGTTNVSYIYAAITTSEMEDQFEDGDFDAMYYSAMEGRSYYPLKKTTLYHEEKDWYYEDIVPGIDVNNNGIMDFEDKTLDGEPYPCVSTEKRVATNKPFDIHLKAEEPYLIQIILWAEGQDPACRGPVSDGLIQFGVDFRVV